MKAVFISFYQAFYDEVIAVLDELEIRGFTTGLRCKGVGRMMVILTTVLIHGLLSTRLFSPL